MNGDEWMNRRWELEYTAGADEYTASTIKALLRGQDEGIVAAANPNYGALASRIVSPHFLF